MRHRQLRNLPQGRIASSALLAASGLLALAVLAAGCKVQVGAGRPTRTAASPAAAPKAAAPRAEGFDEVRDLAPNERVEVDPQAAFTLRAGSGPRGELADRTTPTGLTTIAVLDTARAEARGFLPEGGLREVTLEEGQSAAASFDLAAGECLTVVAHGGLGVREVDAFILAGTGAGADILAQDGAGGPVAIVGGQSGCTRVLSAQRVEVVVQVRKGKGSVVAVVYRGKKPT